MPSTPTIHRAAPSAPRDGPRSAQSVTDASVRDDGARGEHGRARRRRKRRRRCPRRRPRAPCPTPRPTGSTRPRGRASGPDRSGRARVRRRDRSASQAQRDAGARPETAPAPSCPEQLRARPRRRACTCAGSTPNADEERREQIRRRDGALAVGELLRRLREELVGVGLAEDEVRREARGDHERRVVRGSGPAPSPRLICGVRQKSLTTRMCVCSESLAPVLASGAASRRASARARRRGRRVSCWSCACVAVVVVVRVEAADREAHAADDVALHRLDGEGGVDGRRRRRSALL